MPLVKSASAWWGAPRKFDRPPEERRVSWLELFFDLVYVIAIARITHHFSLHVSAAGFIEYGFMFLLIFWGWLNGSLHHDLHGNEGLRTRLMTLWQMMIIAALAITIDLPADSHYFHSMIIFMIMQAYITYIWWSVGFYDKSHRRYNKPYTILYLMALALMGTTLMVSPSWRKFIIPLVIICNYAPPFIAYFFLRRSSLDIDLSSSMVERLGLFTIIVFGEVVLGVVNGISKTPTLHFSGWMNFALAISIVFVLWWIFFTLISNRSVKRGFVNATLLELLYVPALISLGLIAVSFSSFFDQQYDIKIIQKVFGYAVAIFLSDISLMLGLLKIPEIYRSIRRPVRVSLLLTALVFFISTLFDIHLSTLYYLTGVLVILVVEIIYLNSLYYGLKIEQGKDAKTDPVNSV